MKTSKVLTYAALIFVAIVFYEMVWGDMDVANTNTTTQKPNPVYQTDAQREKNYQEGISQITNKKWNSATMLMDPLQKENYKDSTALYNYASAQKYYAEDFMGTGVIERILEHLEPVQASLNKIDVNYSGLFAQDIVSFKAEIEGKRQKLQAKLDTSHEAYVEANKITPGSRKLRIGMGQADAEISMGKPYKINRTVGSYGTHEQWCYNGGVYLYFDDGVLTSWQD